MKTEYRFEAKIQKRLADYDIFRHLNNAIYPQYIETARFMYFGEFLRYDLTKYSGITVKFEIEYIRPADYSDEVCVRIKTKELGRSSMVMQYEVVNAKDKSIVYARGEVKQVCCDAVTAKPIQIPEETRQAVMELEVVEEDEDKVA